MKCVNKGRKGCLAGAENLLYIKGGSHTSKMEHCLPYIYDV
jgi:hypothetical protein